MKNHYPMRCEMATATLEPNVEQATDETYYLITLEINNFKGIRAFRKQLDGRPLKIRGPNGVGKSSVLDAILWGLKPTAVKDITEPIRDGSSECRVFMDFGKFSITRVQKGDRTPALDVRDASGARIKKQQEFIDTLFSEFCLDPLKFINQRGQDQIDVVLQVCGVKPPVEKVMEIMAETIGDDGIFRADERPLFAPRPMESADQYLMRLSADETGVVYVRRREMGRTVDTKRAALEDQRKVLEGLGGPVNGDGHLDAGELTHRLNALNSQRDERNAALSLVQQLEVQHRTARDRLGTIIAQLEHASKESQDTQQRIDETRKLLAALEQKLVEQQAVEQQFAGRIEKGKGVCEELTNQVADARTAAEAIADPAAQIKAVMEQIEQVLAHNSKLVKRQHVTEQVNGLSVEHGQALGHHKRLDDILETLRSLRAHLLDGVDLGVTDLMIGDGDLRLHGAPLKQASLAEQFRTAVAIGVRQNPKLRLGRADNLEHLDQKSQAILFDTYREFRIQPITCEVTDTGELSSEIWDGEWEPTT